ncbi:hypothetical protein J4401_05675 [Candidatus Woesearchaeota archaeon]|nr:hypothetical protein [Candidatus Woesearchaeota archaeon]
MTSVEEHIRKIQEHLEGLNESIERGIEKRPATIAFHCSACSLQLLELYFHAARKIDMGKTLNHEWFKRPTKEQRKEPIAKRHLKIDIPEKSIIYELLYEIEEERGSLMYSKPTEGQTKKVIVAFNKFKGIIGRLLRNEGIEI